MAQFNIEFAFLEEEKRLEVNHSIIEFTENSLSLLETLENSIQHLPEVNLPVFDLETGTVPFDDCIADVQAGRARLTVTIAELSKKLEDFLGDHRHLEPVLSLNPETFSDEFDSKGERSLTDYSKKLDEFDEVLHEVVDIMQPSYRLAIFQLHCKDFKEAAAEHTSALRLRLMVHLKDIAIAELEKSREEFQRIEDEFNKIPQTPEQLAKARQYMEKIVSTVKDRQMKLDYAVQRITFLDRYKFEISDSECQLQYAALSMPRELDHHLERTTDILAREQSRMKVELENNEIALEKAIQELSAEIPGLVARYQDLESTYDANQAVDDMQRTLMDLKKQQELYNSHQVLFGSEPRASKTLSKLAEDFMPIYSLWTLLNDWHVMNSTWLESQFSQIKPDAVNSFMLQSTKKIARLKKDLLPYPELGEKVLIPLSDHVEKFKTHVPLISKLRHPGIKTKHWEKISGIVGFKVIPNDELTLQNFLNLDLGRWNEPISEIANVAAQEYNIESSLDQMDAELQTQLLQTSEFRDTEQYILTHVDDVISLIDDQLVTTQTLLTSPYIAPVKKRATERLSFLRHCHDTLDAWVECQRGWLYLQPIFTGTSIQQKLYQEARNWNTVDKMWSSILGLTHQHPDFVGVMHRDHLFEDLTMANSLLESITQGLNAYLESKRLGFPRFFFLSNDELISILSHTRDFNHINKSINKLFEYIAKMSFEEESIITGMNDEGLETVKFLTAVDGKTEEIEEWLNGFEEEMKTTLKESIRDCIPASQKKRREIWINEFPAQIILITNQIIWTQQVTSALRTPKARGLITLQSRFIEQLEQLTSQIRQPLSLATRQVISCLLINEVHNRDIIANLIQQEVLDVESFKWQIQLRYYWDEDTVMVKCINNVYEYSYEYAGNSARLVITPLTDRCYQTLLSAFKQNMSGAPSGPAGTGKTETARDCAKALGRSCVVYNCSEEVTPEQMSQFFAGLSSSGSWSCFDEFNRINIEVLSVIAQQVRSIQEAIAGNVDTFQLDARTLKLNSNAAIIITMNPGYAGRTELPDNLKALFRPCAMMVPDFGFIAEIMLFSGGFASASALSVKLVALFDLCRKQLSHAHHYDWGLRAMKAILSTAGKAKRGNLEARESLLLVCSIVDCTRPRLVSVDVPLFDGIVQDVFPDISSEKVLNGDLTNYLNQAFLELGCQPLPLYLNKCNEIQETCFVRHGLMFVGGAMGGKSSCWKALAKALDEKYCEKNQGLKVEIRTLNPKAISIPELYGLFDPVTSGWSDGVLSSHIRDCSLTEQNMNRWIIVDGPVDSLWIETMNSLLDDNKVLCLSNNERISLGNQVRMMFEVDDLSQASPATVSRCGMIYFDPSSLPLKAILESWFLRNSRNEKWKLLFEFLQGLMFIYLPILIQFVEIDVKPALGENPNFLVRNFLSLIGCFLDILRDPIEKPPQDGEDAKLIDPLCHELFYSPFVKNRQKPFAYIKSETQNQIFEHIFQFCLVWSFGGVIPMDKRVLFDRFFKELCEKKSSQVHYPSQGLVFDYFFDFNKNQFVQWCEGDTGIDLTSQNEIERILVPTNETGAQLFFARLCAEHSIHLLFHGPESFKTLGINTLLSQVLDSSFECRSFPFSNSSTAATVLKVLRSFLHRRQGVFGPLVNHELIIFLDNIGSVRPEVYGAQPPLELLRQFFDYGGWYDTSCVEFQKVVGTTILAAMGPSGSGLFDIPERLLRHFCFLHIPKLSDNSMLRILEVLLRQRLEGHHESIRELILTTAKASMSVYENCSKTLLPIPSKMHYIFSLRNLVRVIKGILLVEPKSIIDDRQFIKLWFHEMMREFYDRFNQINDRTWFIRSISQIMLSSFRISLETISSRGTIMFNDFVDRSNNYRECILTKEEIMKCCQGALEDYNRESAKSLDIVLFEEAIDHLSSLSRILSMRRGHALLIGVKSSGRKSLARLSLHMSSMEMFEIKITRTYNFIEWREDMKNLMKQCGVNDLPTGFVISDVQIIGQYQLEDVSNLLISGEIPNLFERDEMEAIKGDIAQNEMLTDQDPWVLFLSRIKKHLHILLVFSPFGTIFKDSMLAYPALRTEVTIDWYMPWSRSALESVAQAAFNKCQLGSESLTKSLVNVCVQIHKSVEEEAKLFLTETKRFTACTPSRYFELLNIFVLRLGKQQQVTSESISKYSGGVEKIITTRSQIEELSRQLDRDIPMLQEKRKAVEEMLKELEIKQTEAEAIRVEVKAQSEVAEKEATDAAETNRIAQDKLTEAQPILESAQEAVDSMDRNSLVNIKTLKVIHPALRETFEAICIIFGRTPKKVDTGVPGEKKDDYWTETLQLLNDIQFVKKVKGYEVEKMTKQTIDKLKKYVGTNKTEREQKLSAVQSGYQAVANLYLWVCASFDYWFVYQDILPLKIAAERAASKLAESERVLSERRAHLKSVEDQLENLQQKFSDEKQREQDLANNVAKTQLRLSRAQKIMSGLSGETKRWTECAENLKGSSIYLMGDSILVSGALTHLGAFSPPFRTKLLILWKKFLEQERIQYTKTFNISSALGTDSMIREWIVKGLPNDTHSIENALIIYNSDTGFPLLIDPQLSGTKWLRSQIGESLNVLRFDQNDFLQRLKSCVAFGLPVVIENVGLKLDPLIEPILSREILLVDGQKKIALGGEFCQYSESFRLYLSTKYPNPHYSPEICSQVILINFTTTQEGLSDLLMNNLIEVERDDLDRKRIQIMETNAINIKKLKEVEDEILQIVSNAGSDILDDDNAIETLQRAQKTSTNIEQQMAASEKTERQIGQFREKFGSVAIRAALLYFCAADFSVVDPMYQFSLKWFVGLFKQAIQQSEHPTDIDQLINCFHSAIAKQFYEAVSFSLFSRHKLLFSTLMSIRILFSQKKIASGELAYLLSPQPSKDSNPYSDWLPDSIWSILTTLPSISSAFIPILENVKTDQTFWKHYYNSTQGELEILPNSKRLTPFQKLLILRVFHLHRVREGLRIFVTDSLGKEFVAPPPLILGKVFRESSPLSPLIFIITPGIDPQDEIIGVATSMEMEKYLKSYSLGRGRGKGAEELLQTASEAGFWVLLQNCHLSLSWMPRLEHLIDHLDPEKTNPRFRLCLVTMSSPDFPIGILYSGTKLIYEIPKGIRENILRIYSGFNPDEYEKDITETEKQLTFHLAFFHAVVLERLHFGSIGWNIPYEFNPSDFAISRRHLRTFLGEAINGIIPFEALTYVIGELNYGGRVTDRWDRRLLLSLLSRFFSENITARGFSLGANYPAPSYSGALPDVEKVINTWPVVTEGEDVGLSKNASTITARNDAMGIFGSLVEIQPTLVASSGSISEEQFALNLVEDLIKQVPTQFNVHNYVRTFDLTDTINTVLHHEILLFNHLLTIIKNSLDTLQKGLKGLIVVDEKLELLNRRLLANRIPEIWLDHSYPSVLTMRAYMDDLNTRVTFLDEWVRNKRPAVFNLGAFYHPEEFLTAVLQVYARKHHLPFDCLSWTTEPLDLPFVQSPPDEGIYVLGLFIEGAKWDAVARTLVECGQIELITQLPILHLQPTDKTGSYDLTKTYECPMYRTQNRGSGAMGLPNYLMSLYLPSTGQPPDHWIQRSVAAFITVQN